MRSEDRDQDGSEQMSRSDKRNILILIFLYFLQGLPVGLVISIQLILQNKNVSYQDQAMFSLGMWPFSLKLLWAPIVDSVYWKYMGRRKTWLIFTQYLLGFFMIFFSTYVSSFLGENEDTPNVFALTIAFLFILFLCATQDITVDGWALTMLSRQNVGYAAVCNSAGLKAGKFFGSVVFLVLESPEFCNQYLRSVPQSEGFVNISGFLKVIGIIFCLATTAILIYKSEPEEKYSDNLGLRDTCEQLYHVVCLKNVLLLLVFLLTFQIAHASADSVTNLKFIEAGVRKENVALLSVPMSVVEILFPLYISRRITGINPLNIFLKAFPYKLMFSIFFAVLVWWTYRVKLEYGIFPNYYYAIIVIVFALNQFPTICMHVSVGSFINKVSDPSIGATYMTLLNTFSNIGKSWAHTLALWLVDVLTVKKCENSLFNCDKKESSMKCERAGYSCLTVIDGYYVETIAFVIFGVFWLRWGRCVVTKLQGSLSSEWKTSRYSETKIVKSDHSKA